MPNFSSELGAARDAPTNPAKTPSTAASRRSKVPRVTKAELLEFLREHRLAVEASVSAQGGPQAAVIGVVFGDQLEVFFDTVKSSRKYQNLQRDPRLALVVGWDLERACTVQLEGLADEPEGTELERLRARYFAVFPDGVARAQWPDIAYVRVRPTFLRFSDFRGDTPKIIEFDRVALAALG